MVDRNASTEHCLPCTELLYDADFIRVLQQYHVSKDSFICVLQHGITFLGNFLPTGKRIVFLGLVVGMYIKKLQKTLESQSFPFIWDIQLIW